jgi:hypothetical protein
MGRLYPPTPAAMRCSMRSAGCGHARALACCSLKGCSAALGGPRKLNSRGTTGLQVWTNFWIDGKSIRTTLTKPSTLQVTCAGGVQARGSAARAWQPADCHAADRGTGTARLTRQQAAAAGGAHPAASARSSK